MKLGISIVVTLCVAFTITTFNAKSDNLKTSDETIIKSPNDSREYLTYTLNNGMEVVLVSDPSLATSAMSLSVGVGQYQDPDDYQGLAHYLEHMIFMGSKQNPEPDALMKLVKQHNGVSNAVTQAQQTRFFFSIANDSFAPALALFSSALQAPLLDSHYAQQELKAIDAEWSAAKQSDRFALYRANALTANPAHPMHKFGIGNLSTLKNRTNDPRALALQAFYQHYYSANLMKLVIVSNQPFTQLKPMVNHYFSVIKNNHIKRPVMHTASFTKAQLHKQIYLKTKVQTNTLMLQFPLLNNSSVWSSQPNSYVRYLLTSEEPHTLVATLRDAGLIDNMQVMISPNSYGSDGVIMVDFQLTKQGVAKQDTIIEAFFAYVKQIAQHGVNQQYAQELQHILSNQFANFQPPAALPLAVGIDQQLFDVKARDVLHYHSYFTGLNAAAIQQVLAQMTVDNLRLWHISNTEQTDTDISFANGSYRIADISAAQQQQWQQTSLHVQLPAIDTSPAEVNQKTKTVEDKNMAAPLKVVVQPGLQAWLMNSQYFHQTQGILAINLQSKLYQQDLKHHVMTNLLLTIFSQKARRLAERANRRHQVFISGAQDKYGDIAFNLAGQTAHQANYAEKLFTMFKTFSISQQSLNQAIDIYEKSTENVTKSALHDQAKHYFHIITKTSPFIWDIDQKIATAKSITLTDLTQFHQQLMNDNFLDIFAFGHYDAKYISTLAKQLRTQLGASKQVLLAHPALYRPMADTMINKKVTVAQDNVFLKDSFVYPNASSKVATQLKLLNKLFEPVLFKTLRTKQQLAYEIGSYEENIGEYPAFSLFIQSQNTELVKLHAAFMGFIGEFNQALAETDIKIINQVKQNMINALQQKPVNIYAESMPFYQDWLAQHYQFNSRQKMINDLQHTNKQDLLLLYQQMFINHQTANVLVQLKGNKFANSDFFTQ